MANSRRPCQCIGGCNNTADHPYVLCRECQRAECEPAHRLSAEALDLVYELEQAISDRYGMMPAFGAEERFRDAREDLLAALAERDHYRDALEAIRFELAQPDARAARSAAQITVKDALVRRSNGGGSSTIETRDEDYWEALGDYVDRLLS